MLQTLIGVHTQMEQQRATSCQSRQCDAIFEACEDLPNRILHCSMIQSSQTTTTTNKSKVQTGNAITAQRGFAD